METDFYRVYSEHLREKYGEKVYKLPVNLPVSCPNRDGYISCGGCIFCGEKAAGFESLSSKMSVTAQLEKNAEYIGKKYGAKKFIAYFQNFTNTYMPTDIFEKYMREAAESGVVEIDVSTRPDCINEKYLEILKRVKAEYGVEISVELGLQTANYHTLKKINRGHQLAEFIDAVLQVKKFEFETCAHVILDFPWDTRLDTVETAKIISALGVDGVKLHSLYVVKNTPLAKMFENGEITLFPANEYVERAVLFLRYVSSKTVIHRLVGRAPEEDTLIANSGISWWKIKDMILENMQKENAVQGDLCTYLGGSGVAKF